MDRKSFEDWVEVYKECIENNIKVTNSTVFNGEAIGTWQKK